MNEGCIYIIEDEPNICKIGISKYVDKRVIQLSCKHHKEFIIRGCCDSLRAREEESLIHDFFNNYRIKGEWFRLAYEEIKLKSKEIKIYFDDYDKYIKIKEYVNKAKYHWNEDYEIWVTKVEAGYG